MAFFSFPRRPWLSFGPTLRGTWGVIAFVAALAAFSVYQSRLHYERQARVGAENLAQVLVNHISSTTDQIDLVLKAVGMEMLQQRARGSVDSASLQLFLVQLKLLLPEVGDLLVADADGLVRHGTDVSSDTPIDISDRGYFRRLRDSAHPGLVIDGPVVSRVDQRRAMIFARRLNRPDGFFAGAVVSVVPVEHFREILAAPDMGPNGMTALHGVDMKMVVRVPDVEGASSIGSSILTAPFKASLEADPEKGAFMATSPLDGQVRSFVYRRLAGLPLYMVVGQGQDDYLAAWRKETLEMAGIVVLFAALALGLSRQTRLAMERQQAASHFRATFEQAGVGVCHADREGRFLRVNDKFCAIVGYGREELIGLDSMAVTHPDDRAEGREGWSRLLAGAAGSYSREKRYIRKDGAVVWVNLTVALVQNGAGEPDYFLAVIEDIQQRKDMVRALAEEREARHRILEMEVAARTAELQAANSQLEGFLYAASHDLKGPLGRISSFSSLLEKQYRDRLEGDGILFLDFIRDNALRLTQLIDDLLKHARIDQQVTRLQPISLLDTVRTVLQEKAQDILEHGTAIRLDLPPAEVLADSYGLKQVLDNLLENALKYSSAVDEPLIEVGGQEADGCFRLWVRDNGIGFDMAYQDKIFEIFRRLHTYAEYAGSGVGLALVKRAMDRMGGRVWAEGEPGRGATFYLEFQLAPCEVDCEPACESA